MPVKNFHFTRAAREKLVEDPHLASRMFIEI